MTDFHDKGFALVELFNPQIALDAWDDIDQWEVHTHLREDSKTPIMPLTSPQTPKFGAFVQEIEKVSGSLLSAIAPILVGSKCSDAGSDTVTRGRSQK